MSQLFFDSLALSAWKQVGERKWAVRCNPSSGNLHPTEAYLLAPPIPGLTDCGGLFHYDPYTHALEVRGRFPAPVPANRLLMGLTTIHWRESWKYGERAFRYCHMDMGHAVGAIAVAAALLGWCTRIVDSVTDETLRRWLGIEGQSGVEAEHPACLLYLFPPDATPAAPEFGAFLPGVLQGRPNRLSLSHHDWPVIDAAAAATERLTAQEDGFARAPRTIEFDHGEVSARRVIRQRRSALSMDGRTAIDADVFYRMMQAVQPGRCPFHALSSCAAVHLALHVHRVEGLPPGLYILVRNEDDLPRLRAACRKGFAWDAPPRCPDGLRLFLLEASDERRAARTIACSQDIAGDGVFALGMIAPFIPLLERQGAWTYKRLHWEAGMVGQVLYLEAEAAGIRGTGIGCYFDDEMHQRLGLQDRSIQSLYHFTVGGAVEDPRLRSRPAYAHLGRDA